MGMMFFCNRCGKQVDRETLGRLGGWSYPYKPYRNTADVVVACAMANANAYGNLTDPITVQSGYDYCEDCRAKLIQLIENFNQNKI